MAMGGLFASGICQREGNGIYCKTMQRFDARQQTRRLTAQQTYTKYNTWCYTTSMV